MNRLIAVFAGLGLVVTSNSIFSEVKKSVLAHGCGLTHLRHRFHLTRYVSGAVVALLLAIASTGPAQAGCTISDVGDAVKSAIDSAESFLQSPACLPLMDNPAFWFVSGAVTVATMATTDIKDACDAVQSAGNSVVDAEKDVRTFYDKLPADAQKAFSDVLGDINAIGGQLNPVIDFVSCACAVATSTGMAAITDVAGACLKDALCDLDDYLFDKGSCDNTPRPIELIDCTQQDFYAGGNYWGPPCKDGFCSETQYANPGYSGMACFCPPPMQMVFEGFSDADAPKWQCRCPRGSTSAGLGPGSSRICLCPDETPVQANGTCLPPCQCSCPNNQIVKSSSRKSDGTCNCNCGCPADRVLKAGRCELPPCATGQTRLPNGKCCLVSQATSCGDCCPAGKKPNAKGDACEIINVQVTPSIPIPNMTLTPTRPLQR